MIRTAIIEDDPVVLDYVASLVRAESDLALVAIGTNAAEGAALIDAGGYDVLLCDLGLPDGEGATLIRQSTRQNPEADVIVVTMFAHHSKVIESIKAGAKGYLLKDDSLDDCVASIRQIRAGGSPISPVIARQLLRRLQPQTDSQQDELSERERHVLSLLARGYSYNEIAGLLEISAATVATYVKRLYRKLEVRSRAEAVFEASSRGILDGG